MRTTFHTIGQLDAPAIRAFVIHMGETRNTGSVHAAYRAIKVFLNWWAAETEPAGWKNPIEKVHVNRLSAEPRPGISWEQVLQGLPGTTGQAILCFLPDSGVRREELASLNIADVNLDTGAVTVRKGKGDKYRITYIGAKTKREVTRCGSREWANG